MNLTFLSKEYSAKELMGDLSPALAEYEKEMPVLPAITPDIRPRQNYQRAAKAVVSNIGVLDNGLNAIRVHPSAHSIEMAVAIYDAVNKIGGSSIMFLHPMDDALDVLLRDATKEKIETFKNVYIDAINTVNHWTITHGAKGYKTSEKAKENNPMYGEIVGSAASRHLNGNIATGHLHSWNMIYAPQPYSADRIGMDFAEYTSRILKAMQGKTEKILKKETDQAIASFAEQVSPTRLIGKSGIFSLQIGDTELQFQVDGRQVYRDVGRVGVDTEADGSSKPTTNNPCGEFFVAPIETSVKGVLGTVVPSETGLGVLDRTYFTFEDGLAIGLNTSDNNLFEKAFSDKSTRTVAELGFGGQNPGLDFLVEIGKPTGDPLIDEKVYPLHIAIGENTHMGGKNEANKHHDFSIGQEGKEYNRPLNVRKI